MNGWQHGFEMEKLKPFAELFKREFSPMVYGAFGVPNERDVAEALKRSEVIWTTLGSIDPASAALFRVLKAPSRQEDFAGRLFTPKKGDLVVRALAARGASEEETRKLLEGLTARAKASSKAMWVEVFEEQPRTRFVVESCGFRWVGTKIAASSELKGLYHRGETEGRMPEQQLGRADVVGIKVVQPAFLQAGLLEQVQAEIQAFEETKPWAQHYSSYNKRSSWTAFSLCGYDPKDPSFIEKPAEMSRKWKEANAQRLKATCEPTTAAPAFPWTMQMVGRIPGRKQRVRFMALAPGNGELSRHADITDPEAGAQIGQVARLHIPIETNSACVFSSWDLRGTKQSMHFPRGALCYLDTRKPHTVVNGGPERRVHLVVDTFVTAELRRWLEL